MTPDRVPLPEARGASPLPRLPRISAWVVALLVAVEFLQWTVVLPADVQAALGFHREDLEVGRWWTTLTFPLVHRDLTLLLLNAYAIALFGSRLEVAWGARRYLAFLWLAGLGAWMLQLLTGSEGVLLGASAAAFAVLGAYAMRWGGDVHGTAGGLEMRGRWLTVLVGTMVLLVGLRSGDGGGLPFLAHLGGLATAWLFVRATPVQLAETLRDGVTALPDEPPEDQLPRAVPRTAPRSRAKDRDSIDDVVSRTNAAAARRSSAPRRRAKPEAPPAAPPTVDAILDKISAEGIDRLTDEERRILQDHAKRMRDG
ncbi:MAG: rhomboid family intramembrane serine protease [Gemmatimonadaceae bacterium]|nr:rhomboid family intramembrane serine protease [Gemmatimonadaceae bacterium]